MKQYFFDIIHILAAEKPDCLDNASALLTADTLQYYPQVLYKYRSFDENGYSIDSLENDYLWADFPSSFDDPVDAAVNLKLKTELKDIENWMYAHMGEILFFNIPPKGMKQQKQGQTLVKYKEAQKQFVNSDGKIDAKAVQRSMYTEINKLPPKQRQDVLRAYKNFETPEFEKNVEESIKQTLDGIVDAFRKKTLIACLTERNDNQKMWEDYSGKYSGFVIGYKRPDYGSLNDEEKRLLVSLLPVKYYKRIPKVELLPFIQYVFHKDLYGTEKDISEAKKKLFRQMLYKRYEYNSEEEWRIICNSKEQKIAFPYASAVYAGYKIEDDKLEQLKTICQRKKLPLYRQTFNKATGKMNFKPVMEDNYNA